MTILSQLPCDGTFDQLQPLRAFRGKFEVFSLYLTAATDRWPVDLIARLIRATFNTVLGEAVVFAALTLNKGVFHQETDKPSSSCGFYAGTALRLLLFLGTVCIIPPLVCSRSGVSREGILQFWNLG